VGVPSGMMWPTHPSLIGELNLVRTSRGGSVVLSNELIEPDLRRLIAPVT